MPENWIIQNIQLSLLVWNEKLHEIWDLIRLSPQEFRDGLIWRIIENVHGGVRAVAYALLVLFFAAGVVRTCGSFADLKRPEHALKLFVRFAVAKALVTHGMELMLRFLEAVRGVIGTVMETGGFAAPEYAPVPEEVVAAVESAGFLESVPLWALTLIGCLLVWVLSFVMILSVYGRFFRLYMYTALAPLPLAAFAGEPTQNMGKSFLKSYAAVCLEGAVIVLACMIFSVFGGSVPELSADAAPVTMVWNYLGELVFNMLILTGSVKAADRITKELLFS